jgi:Leucine-rich repeat (LRR) protein
MASKQAPAAAPAPEPSAEEVTGEVEPVVLTEDMISNGLSELARTVDGTSVAMTKLQLPGMKLGDVTSISLLNHVRHIDISSNFITDLSPLYGLEHLLSINASNNKIETVEFPRMNFVQLLDLSDNQIQGSLSSIDMPCLRHLKLSNNQLESVSGLEKNTQLQRLEVDNNKLASSEGLGIASLKTISLHINQLTEVKGLSNLVLITSLKLTNNAIVSFEGLPHTGALTKIEAAQNQLASIDDALKGHVPSSVMDLDVAENPIMEGLERVQVLVVLENLKTLNNVPVTPEELASAELIRNPPPPPPVEEPAPE